MGQCRRSEPLAWPKPSLGRAQQARDASLSMKTVMLQVLHTCREHTATTTSMRSLRGLRKRQGHHRLGVVMGKRLLVPTVAVAVGDVAVVAEAVVRRLPLANPTRLLTTMRIKCLYQPKTTSTKFQWQVRLWM